MLIVTKQPIPSEKSTNGRALRAVTLIFLLRMLPRMECETYELKCKTHRKYEKPIKFYTSEHQGLVKKGLVKEALFALFFFNHYWQDQA